MVDLTGLRGPKGDEPTSPRSSWLAPVLIFIVVLLGYGIAPTRFPLAGEETCRALHGIEMARTGDWLIARNQGVPILDRPPMQYWMLGAIHAWVHPLDPLALRMFMALVTLATSLLAWWYARGFVSPAGALLAGVCYPTMGHVFDLGRRVETDGLFTLWLAGALLVWHAGYSRRWRPVWMWSAACVLAAFATLTKGLQAPVGFFGAVYAFLLLRRDWRSLLHWSHLIGLGVFVALIAVWQIPFFREAGWAGTRATWLDPGTSRVSADAATLAAHLATFPLKVFVALLPWSPLLLALVDPRFRRVDEKLRSCLLFLLLGIAAIFVPVWATAGGNHRYTMPMYPLVSAVCGIIAHRCLSFDMSCSLRRFWRDYIRIFSIALAAACLALVAATIVGGLSDAGWARRVSQPWWLLAALLPCVGAAAFILWKRARTDSSSASGTTPFLLAALVASFYNGPVMNALVVNAMDVGPEVARVRAGLPPRAHLVSLRPIHHRFLYWYGDSIPIVPWPESEADAPGDLEYFVFTSKRGRSMELPFAWEKLAVINMDRTKGDNPENSVVLGRRLGVEAAR